MKKIKIIVTDRCCGKTTLANENSNYLDFDVFNLNIQNLPSYEDIMVYILDKITDSEDKIVMMNYGWTKFFDLFKEHFELDVKCFIPEATEESKEFRINLEKERDIEKFGVVKEKVIEKVAYSFLQKEQEFENWAKENGYEYKLLKVDEYISEEVKQKEEE